MKSNQKKEVGGLYLSCTFYNSVVEQVDTADTEYVFVVGGDDSIFTAVFAIRQVENEFNIRITIKILYYKCNGISKNGNNS